MTRTNPRSAGTDATSVGLHLTKFRDPLRIPPVLRPRPEQLLTVHLRAIQARLHSELPPTRLWAYDGHSPGPTIEVRRGQQLRVIWQNEVTGSYPLAAVEIPGLVSATVTPDPGRDGVEPVPGVAALPPWTVVHLHGSRTSAGNDGWPENPVLPGNAQLSEYANDQEPTTLWYHDHAMAITALNVMTGLAGMYLIRDDEEDQLRLPSGDHEVPLIITDRNLDTDAAGNLTGQLLHKVGIFSTVPMKVTLPFLGPFTLVNGVIWPHFDVAARWYRFRMLNASNARFYTLELHDEKGATVPDMLHQIGTDGGLLPGPVTLSQLILAPAERADVLVDFSAFQGRSLTLVNTFIPPLDPATGTPNLDIMQFRVKPHPTHDNFTLPDTLSTSFVRLTHDTLPEHMHRWLVLTVPAGGHPQMWEMREIEEPPPNLPTDGIIQVVLPDGVTVKTLQRISRDFKDAANFYVEYNGWEQWSFLNASPVAHPMHIHLIRFQALSRDSYDIGGFDPVTGGTRTPLTPQGPLPVDPNEQGWKDTIRVSGGQLVSVAGQFGGGNGRYVYHCHILEHEDEGMMRTFVVMPKEVMAVDPDISDGHHPLHAM